MKAPIIVVILLIYIVAGVILWRIQRYVNRHAKRINKLLEDQNRVREKYDNLRLHTPDNWDDVERMRQEGKKL